MPVHDTPLQYLLTLPRRMAQEFETLEGRKSPEWFASSDPMPLGSGGGTAHLLAEAWRATAPTRSFEEWLRQNRETDMVRNGMIKAHSSASRLEGDAREHHALSSGLEPINPDGDPRAPRPLNSAVSPIKTEDDRAAKAAA